MSVDNEYSRIKRAAAEVLLKSGEYRKAGQYFKQYFAISDSLNSANSLRQLNQFNVLYDLQRAQDEKAESDRKTQRTRHIMITSVTLSLAVLLASALFFIIFLRRANIKLSRSEKNLKVALKKAEESDNLKSAFLANMSHEIRTPLNSIVGFSEVVADTEDPTERQNFTKIIKSNSDQLLLILNDILDLSKIESGTIDYNKKPFDFVPFFDTLYHSLENLPRSASVNFQIDSPSSSYPVYMDQNRVSQIITNFVTNSFKFTSQGEIRMGYKEEEKDVYIYVTDTGRGIPSELKEKVFERFYQIDDFAIGAGIGLTIAKAITDVAGGQIGVDSEQGKGSTFWVRIPSV